MNITVNGRAESICDGTTLAALVASKDLPQQGIAIALNLAVVRADAWRTTRLAGGDVIDIVTARQGG